MAKKKQSRPILVWVISIIFSLLVVAQIIAQSLILFGPYPEVKSIVESWSLLDRASPYILAVVLVAATVQFFHLQKNSINWLGAYLGLTVLLTIQQAFTNVWLLNIETYSLTGLQRAMGSIAISALVLGYMLWLQKKEVLT